MIRKKETFILKFLSPLIICTNSFLTFVFSSPPFLSWLIYPVSPTQHGPFFNLCLLLSLHPSFTLGRYT